MAAHRGWQRLPPGSSGGAARDKWADASSGTARWALLASTFAPRGISARAGGTT